MGNEKQYAELAAILAGAERMVFLGGAWVSTGSGIRDFRGSAGLYTASAPEEEPPERVLSGTYLRRFPEKFFAYYRRHMLYPSARPNAAHRALAQLEREGKLTAVITQNIDGLHQAAGSHNVLELHGSVLRNECLSCGREYPLSLVLETDGVPHCPACGGNIRPDVVRILTRAVNAIRAADVLLVGGTSLTVYPAAALPDEFTGKHLVIINRTPTPLDRRAELVIRDPIQNVLPAAIGLSAD